MLTLNLAAALLVFVFTTVLTIAGVGSAFIVIPTFYWLGVPLTEAMAIGLLLNAISMTFASANYIRYKLVLFRTALPIIVLAIVFSPLGAYSTRYFPKNVLILLFVIFLVFAASMMLFYKPKKKEEGQWRRREGTQDRHRSRHRGGVSRRAPGRGGREFHRACSRVARHRPKKSIGNYCLHRCLFVALGILRPRCHGSINWNLLTFAAIGSIAGAILGSWLMHKKLDAGQVKKIIGIVLYAIAAKMAWGLL